MPALIDIRRRIRSVKNTQQITKAMKMVSAAKLRRAQEAMFAARPYARRMLEVLNSLATRANPETHPLLRERLVERLLPIQRLTLEPAEPAQDYIYEPGPKQIFEHVLPKHVEVQVWRALLESAAAEHGARMAAMDAATNNAGEMIERLTLYMNKVRQAAITKEIIEVVSGAGS
jgi:F0F1-type ATP synthase gamma subunit